MRRSWGEREEDQRGSPFTEPSEGAKQQVDGKLLLDRLLGRLDSVWDADDADLEGNDSVAAAAVGGGLDPLPGGRHQM